MPGALWTVPKWAELFGSDLCENFASQNLLMIRIFYSIGISKLEHILCFLFFCDFSSEEVIF